MVWVLQKQVSVTLTSRLRSDSTRPVKLASYAPALGTLRLNASRETGINGQKIGS